ncbi:NADH dehydrogenase [ubiquinone] 1 alpha subcomplex subunit 10, mitochondrial [Hylaeus anthracinus]|uniref:NADH dehydrogenase [ubiquinone] 1 alpha subcomplex subunit 10, mitochondrial n=1 Tax=Hylaeus anthracinus TaxID=313031 RepID=UPI0023B93454|nr:NADH dehydrogenase [ubiquinone] 1 alpha subcomplex subunit 10, mitochondrial [Hylaeus anthracinus]XP_054009729.1 NADH dehydrogenase [ubiquinone] 1 alpha subcomplex subunit 10, mitochondrial [Hylaeus anthracinus]
MALKFLATISKVSPVGCSNRLCKTSRSHNVKQVASLTRLAYKKSDAQKPAPFPYWKKKFGLYHVIFDPVLYRYDGNTKLIVVDGPPAIGKAKFCEKLADEFGLLYMPAPTHDEFYINHYGVDLRELDPKLPFLCKSYDVPRYLENPNDKRVARFQMVYLHMRTEQYINALLHLLSTGQGVVLNRSVYSDSVFAEVMKNFGYISEHVYAHYTRISTIAKNYFLRPHLIIYLDVAPEIVKEKIKQKGIPYEVNSKVLTTKYLTDLENVYKEKYLKKMADHSHLLIYDWSKEGDLTSVVEDIEELDLANYEQNKMSDWVFNEPDEIIKLRYQYGQDRYTIFRDMVQFNEPDFPSELIWTPEEVIAMDEALENSTSEKFLPGFIEKLGDKVLWKSDKYEYPSYRRTPRDFVNRAKYMS